MREFKLIKWYDTCPEEWKEPDYPIVLVKRDLGYYLHPSLYNKVRSWSLFTEWVENDPEHWLELKPENI